MNNFTISIGIRALLLSVLSSSMLLPVSASAQEYSFFELKHPQTTRTTPTAINNRGDVIGITGENRAFLFSNGKFTDLESLDGQSATTTRARAINIKGDVIGTSNQGWGNSRAFLYRSGKMTSLGADVGLRSCPMGINDAGRIVGWAQLSDDTYRGFIYDDHGLKPLPSSESFPLSITNSGTILTPGSMWTTDGRETKFKAPNGEFCSPRAINEKDEVLCEARMGGPNQPVHSFFYSVGQMTDLGVVDTSSKFTFVIGNALNVRGDVVGTLQEPPGSSPLTHAFLYQKGKIIDLNDIKGTQIPTEITLDNAVGITDTGVMLVTGRDNHGGHTYIVTPK